MASGPNYTQASLVRTAQAQIPVVPAIRFPAQRGALGPRDVLCGADGGSTVPITPGKAGGAASARDLTACSSGQPSTPSRARSGGPRRDARNSPEGGVANSVSKGGSMALP